MSAGAHNPERRKESADLRDRIHALEVAVEHLSGQIESLVHILDAARGFFTVLEFIGRMAKPVLIVGGLFAAVAAALNRAKTGT